MRAQSEASDEIFEVRVGKMPGTITHVVLNGSHTVADALRAAGLDAAGYQIHVDGEIVGMTDELQGGDTVLLLKKIKGN